jgi:hypothetical protein
MRGQSRGKMPRGRHRVLKSLVETHDKGLIDQVGKPVELLNDLQKNALLWRIDVEKAVCSINEAKRGLLITYEELCEDPLQIIQDVCDELGIDFDPQMKRFICKLEKIQDEASKKIKAADVRDSYFTVYRNPKKQKDRWKKELNREEIREIEDIVKNSHAFAALSEHGGW